MRNRLQIRVQHPWRVSIAVLGFALLVPVSIDLLLYLRIRALATRVSVGMTRAEVVEIMGEPSRVYARSLLNGFRSEWAYHSGLNWGGFFSSEPPYFQPIRPVLSFGASRGDVAVSFDGSGRVQTVRIPGDRR